MFILTQGKSVRTRKNSRKLGAHGVVAAKPADEKRILSALYRFKFEPLV